MPKKASEKIIWCFLTLKKNVSYTTCWRIVIWADKKWQWFYAGRTLSHMISFMASGEWSDMIFTSDKFNFHFLSSLQDQQQKQLELILAIGKSGKLWDNRREPVQELIKTSDLTEGVKKLETQETQPSVASKGSNNDGP